MASFTVSDVTVSEHDAFADVTISLVSPQTSTVTVQYGTTVATATTSDFVSVSGDLTFAVGEVSKVVRIPLRADSAVERLEGFYLSVFQGNGAVAGIPGLITIVDDDRAAGTPLASVHDVFVDESERIASFVVTLDRPSSKAVTIDYAFAQDGGIKDYIGSAGTVRFKPGDTAQTITVKIKDDSLVEGIDRFDLVLSNLVNATAFDTRATAFIGASDRPTKTTPTISVSNPIVGEGDGFAEFVVQLEAPSTSTTTFSYGIRGGTTASADLVGRSGQVIFAPGQTLTTIRVPIVDDPQVEKRESFALDLYLANGSTFRTGIGTIIDNDEVVATPTISIANVIYDEAAGIATFAVTLSGPASDAVVATYSTADVTATAGSDYRATDGVIQFAAGETAKSVSVVIIDDGAAEKAEAFQLILTDPVSGAAIAAGTATIAASDGVAVSSPTVTVRNVVANEGVGYVDAIVELNAPGTNRFSIVYNTQDGSATAASGDFVGASGTVEFAPGETLKTIRLMIGDDDRSESRESFLLNLLNGNGSTRGSGTVTIADNDAAPAGLAAVHADYHVPVSSDFVAPSMFHSHFHLV